jgi:hypothetical protein
MAEEKMRGLLIVLVVIAVVVVGVGFYQGWFSFSSDSDDGKGHITLELNKDKFEQDRKRALEGVQHLGHKGSEKAKDQAAPPVQPPQN